MTTKAVLKWWAIDILVMLVCYAIEVMTASSIPFMALVFGIIGIGTAVAFGSVFPILLLYTLIVKVRLKMQRAYGQGAKRTIRQIILDDMKWTRENWFKVAILLAILWFLIVFTRAVNHPHIKIDKGCGPFPCLNLK